MIEEHMEKIARELQMSSPRYFRIALWGKQIANARERIRKLENRRPKKGD